MKPIVILIWIAGLLLLGALLIIGIIHPQLSQRDIECRKDAAAC